MKSYPIASRTACFAAALVVLAALLPGRINAQVASGGGTTINSTSAGYLGILKLRCDCTLRVDPDERYRYFSFRSDPVIGGIEAGSPAEGVLRTGDYITHVDGQSIRSSAGAQKFATIQPGQSVELTIRRNGRTSKARITAAAMDWNDFRVLGTLAPDASGIGYGVTWETPSIPPEPAIPGFPAAPAPRPSPTPRAPRAAVGPRPAVPPQVWSDVTPAPAQPSAPATPAEPVVPAQPGFGTVWAVVPESPVAPRGWFGFSFRCSNCGWSSAGSRGADPVWESGDGPPELTMISRGGPADRAGLKVGDVMTHLDGLPISRPDGARKLGAVKPGQRVRVTVIRDGKSITRELTLGTRPEARAVVAATPATPRPPRAVVTPGARRELRYTGKIEDVAVEVWSPAGTSVERIGDTMVITVGTTVVRLKADPKK